MSFKTIRQAIPQWKAGAIPLLQWSYSVESQTGIWKTNNGSINPFLTFFPPPKKDNEANKNETRPKIK